MSGEPLLLVITEPASQDGDGESVRVALDVLRGAAPVKVVTPTTPQELDQALARRGRRRLVVVGGDGLLHAVVETLHRRRELASSPLGWVPPQSGNELAGRLGIPDDVAGAARVVLAGIERWLDLLVDDAGGIAVNSVRVGPPPDTNGTAPHSSPLVRAFSRLSWRLGHPRRSCLRLRVEADGTLLTDLDRRVLLVGVGNGTGVGGTGSAAEVSLDDGLAEVVVSEPVGRLGRLGRLTQPARQRGDDTTRGGLRMVQARAVTVSGPDFPYQADGVACGPVRLRTWTVEHSAWRVTVPASV